ncbi:MAG: two-component sensor histidine kinase [Gammaproteobacteria bacterium]|nr:two-component sensor histidine kinase [Gammaproteobacteria bacterium]
MKTSIRKFLLINLLLAISITTTLTAIGNYYLDQKDIQEHLDTLMAVSGLSYEALLGNTPNKNTLKKIQTSLENMPQKIKANEPSPRPDQPSLEAYLSRFSFQVWSSQGKRLLYSPDAPALSPDKIEDGFSNAFINKQRWRIFSTVHEPSGSRFILAERYDTRNELRRRIAQDDLYIMLLTFPLSGFLIWIIIGRGLGSLDRVAKEVAHRAPSHLEPVNLESAPDEIKPMIDELNKLFFRLQEGFEREKRFAADAAHELRTPLAAIKTQAQVALNTSDTDEKNSALEKLITSVNRTTHIVQQLLTMSRLLPDVPDSTGFESVNLVQMTRDMLTILVPKAIEKHIELEFQANQKTPSFQGNATALCILIRNLVDNAIRYTPENGVITVCVRPDKNRALLEISDNGPGIPEAFQTRVFERFFRVIGNKASGSGLGLAIVKQIATLHQAHIELDKPQNHSGLIVRISFPCCPKHGSDFSE